MVVRCVFVEGGRVRWWDQRLPGLASPHIKPDSIFWQSTQLHSWVIFTTPENTEAPQLTRHHG